MNYNPRKHHRRSLRLKGYDYSQEGHYFVTICVQEGRCLLSAVEEGTLVQTAAGKMVNSVWHDLPIKYPSLALDSFVAMPNHVHFIVALTQPPVGTGLRARPASPAEPPVGSGPRARPALETEPLVGTGPRARPASQTAPEEGQTRRSVPTEDALRPSLPEVVQWFKSMTTTKYRHGVRDQGWHPFNGRLWQLNYYEQIIRNERHLNAIRTYIANNPANWEKDQLNPG